MNKRKVKKEEEEFYIKCPHCKKEIKGSTESQVTYNLGIHIQAKHSEKKQ
jgi:hypothetical protein